jgi:hypothetical protein
MCYDEIGLCAPNIDTTLRFNSSYKLKGPWDCLKRERIFTLAIYNFSHPIQTPILKLVMLVFVIFNWEVNETILNLIQWQKLWVELEALTNRPHYDVYNNAL